MIVTSAVCEYINSCQLPAPSTESIYRIAINVDSVQSAFPSQSEFPYHVVDFHLSTNRRWHDGVAYYFPSLPLFHISLKTSLAQGTQHFGRRNGLCLHSAIAQGVTPLGTVGNTGVECCLTGCDPVGTPLEMLSEMVEKWQQTRNAFKNLSL